METIVETKRLILREILPRDEEGLFELDSDPDVHRYLGNNPLKNIEQVREVIQLIRQQYIDNGIGRWAIIEKHTNNFIGWTGLKLYRNSVNNHSNFYELGYRLIKKYWGRGIATETAFASLSYGFSRLNLNEIYAMTDIDNANSRKVLLKAGFKYIEDFDYDASKKAWFKICRSEWLLNSSKKISLSDPTVL